jgi:hypothetical protein
MKKIPCKHETGEVPDTHTTVSDYYPLSRDEVVTLLEEAKSGGRIVSEVQVRLNQGIKGMTCPRPIVGDVAERSNKLDQFYVDNYEYGAIPRVVDTIMDLLG